MSYACRGQKETARSLGTRDKYGHEQPDVWWECMLFAIAINALNYRSMSPALNSSVIISPIPPGPMCFPPDESPDAHHSTLPSSSSSFGFLFQPSLPFLPFSSLPFLVFMLNSGVLCTSKPVMVALVKKNFI